MTPDGTYVPKIYEKDGGNTQIVASGGVINIETGGALQLNAVDVTALLAAIVANQVGGIGASYKVARGQHTQVAASDTVVTGLTTVVAVIASWESNPTVKQLFLAAAIGDQAGSPAAGSILLKTFKPTAVNDVTPTAATDFTDNLKVNWIAIGT